MKIYTLAVGQLGTNCYLLEDEGGRSACRQAGIVDPGDDGDYILRKIGDLKAKPVWIVATHGHFDHVLGVCEIALAANIPFYLHPKDNFLLGQAQKSAQYFTRTYADPMLIKPQPVKEGFKLLVGKSELEVIETPGHTPGGISLYSRENQAVFCGDLVFAQGVGRTDFSYASHQELERSIGKILKLPEETIIYPGHEKATTIGKIKRELM